MPALSIRNLPSEVHARLRIRAARAGRSMEAEARALLVAACAPEAPDSDVSDLQDWIQTLYSGVLPNHASDDLIGERRREAEAE